MASEILWEVPEPASTCEVRPDAETVITVRRHGNPAGPRLVMSHGNGLAIDLYFPFWSLLMDDFDLMIYDLRNHGWNKTGAVHNHNMPFFVHDHNCILAAIDEQYGKKPKIGVFHSVASLITLMSNSILADPAAIPSGAEFSALVLFDPPICRPGINDVRWDESVETLAGLTRQRAQKFKSREQYVDLLEILPMYKHCVPGVRELVAMTTLRESVDEKDFELCCPAEYEARIIEFTRSFSPLVDLEALPCPTKAICADPTMPYSFLPTLDMSGILTVDYDFLPDTTHFLQLEQPEECVATMREFLEQDVPAGSL